MSVVKSIYACNTFANANEDNFFVPNQREHGTSNIESFGIFDGHFGSFASLILSLHLHPATRSRLEKMLEILDTLTSFISVSTFDPHKDLSTLISKLLSSSLIYEAILCEAYRRSCQIFDEEIRLKNRSGSTAVSLFISKLSNGKSRLITTNTGDSRCALFCSPKSNLSNSKCLESINERKVETRFKFNKQKSSLLTAFKNLFKICQTESNVTEWIPFAVSKDHNLFNYTEKDRVERTSFEIPEYNPCWSALPGNITMDDVTVLLNTTRPERNASSKTKKSSGGKSKSNSYFDENDFLKLCARLQDVFTDPEDRREACSNYNFLSTTYMTDPETGVLLALVDEIIFFISTCSCGESYNGTESYIEKQLKRTTPHNVPIEDPEYQLTHEESFIRRRRTSDGREIGPLAVFGRYNLSVSMTRSIGE